MFHFVILKIFQFFNCHKIVKNFNIIFNLLSFDLNFMSLTSFENYKFIVSSLRCINTKETHYILRFINYYQVVVALKS